MANRSSGPTDPWVELSHGRTIGKTGNIAFPSPASPLTSVIARGGLVDLLQIQGKDDNALQLCITLLPPLAIPARQFPGGILPTDQGIILAATGARSNDDLYLHPPIGGADYLWPRLACKLSWGIGGVQSEVECDFINGLAINVCASWIRLSVFIDYGFEPLGLEGSIINLGAFVGPGFPKSNNAQKTLNVGPLPIGPNTFPTFGFNGTPTPPSFTIPVPFVGAANLFPVPRYGKQFQLISVDVGAVPPSVVNTLDCNIIFFRDIAGLLRSGSYRITSANQVDRFLIPTGSYYWTIQNNAIVNIDNIDVIFDLAV